jgi:hypothetical protein
MSTAARKARKRQNNILRSTAGLGPVAYQHPVKEYTPIIDRAENKPQRFHDGTRTTSAARKRIMSAAEVLFSDNDVNENDTKLDPKPWRIGRKRYTLEELADRSIESEAGQSAVFSPRKGYEAQPEPYFA